MKNLKLWILILTMTALSGCHYKVNKIADEEKPAPLGERPVDFAFVMQEVIGPKCLECHSNAGGNRGHLNFETYAAVKSEIQAIQDSVEFNDMPLNRTPLTETQRQILNNWVAAGAPEFVTNTAESDVKAMEEIPLLSGETVLDWETIRTTVVQPKCLNCHAEPTNRGGVNLETYANVQSRLAVIDQVIKDGSMPRRTTLTPEEKEMILTWIQIGAPEFAPK